MTHCVAIDATSLQDLHSGVARRLLALWSRIPAHFDDGEVRWLMPAPAKLVDRLKERLPAFEVMPLEVSTSPLGRWLGSHRRLLSWLGTEHVDLFFQDTRPLADPSRTIPTVHDLRALDPRFASAGRRLYANFLWPRQLRACPAILTVSKGVKERIVRELGVGKERVEHIRNGVEPGVFDLPRRLPQSIRDFVAGRPFFLTVGHREPRKNLEFAIDLLRDLKDHEADWCMVSVGRSISGFDAPQRKAHESMLEDRVLWLDQVEDDLLAALYQSARALVFPSLLEGFGIPPLEAMAASCPVLTPDEAPYDEFIPDSARFPRSLDAWRQQLLKLDADPPYREALILENKAVVDRMTWDAPARCLADIIRSCRVRE